MATYIGSHLYCSSALSIVRASMKRLSMTSIEKFGTMTPSVGKRIIFVGRTLITYYQDWNNNHYEPFVVSY